MNTKICLYGHDWNYIDNYSTFIAYLQSQRIAYEIVFLKKNSGVNFHSLLTHYKKKYGEKFIVLHEKIFPKKHAWPFGTIPFLGFILETIFAIHQLTSFFKEKRYSHLIVSDDRIYESWIVLAAAKRNIPPKIVLYPVEGFQTIEGALLPKLQEAKTLPQSFLKTIAFSLAKILYPSNVLRVQNRDVSFISPRQVLQLHLLGILPKNPWLRGTNAVDLVAVNSHAQREENIKLGMDSAKIQVTGFPPHDSLGSLMDERSERKQKFCEILGIDPSKKIFLVVGTSYSDDFHPRQFSALDFEVNQVLARLLQTLRGNFYFIFKPHPRMEPQPQIRMFQKEIGKTISFGGANWTMYELIGVSDAILNFVSASTDASLATNVPIFSYKLQGRTIFETETARYRSITPVYSIRQLEQNALRLKNSTELYPEVKKMRDQDRRRYGMFDEKNTERFARLLFIVPAPHENIH